MNEQHQYEKRLAEKFQQLPLPDVDPNWQQMKTLLDKEMPRRGAYWRWFRGIGVLLLMLGGAWIFITQQEPDSLARNEVGKSSQKTEQSSPQSSDASQDAGMIKSENGNSEISEEALPGATAKQSTETKTTKDIEENLHINSDNKTVAGADLKDEKLNDRRLSVPGSQPKKNDRRIIRDNNVPSNLPDEKPFASNDAQLRDGGVVDRGEMLRSGLTGSVPSIDDSKESIKQIQVRPAGGNFSDPEVEKIIGDSIRNNYSNLFPEEQITAKNARKSAKMSALASVENRKVALGFSLPMGFPLGDQKPGAYNINARPNTISDFLPVPHMQYHINDKVYLQTEVQLMNPQFIQPVLLFQTKTEFPSTNTMHYNSVYARKLYYFNIPVGIHYSPFAHFYLGTGLQFSSLLSGVALREETSFVIGSGTNNLLSQQYSKFRNDSLSNRIDNSEFRLMLDANYYWKQFTVGLRYNQALSNYVSLRLNNVSPLFTDKNKSLQFYLRYNIWEDYRRKKK